MLKMEERGKAYAAKEDTQRVGVTEGNKRRWRTFEALMRQHLVQSGAESILASVLAVTT